ncbi:AAA family ATPase [Novosphingobium sp.]|uniref:ATP-binding protein n=1 Tax=Novosphingobium sp. TaxID=1874826 RepID=UPI00260FD440|nr:AAA family ATPase [Novosphingobium sp.]
MFGKSTPSEPDDSPIDMLEALDAKGPATVKGDDLPHFQGDASDLVRPGEPGKFARIRTRLRTACTPSRPIKNPAMLAGRRDILRTLVRSIEDQQFHVVVYGERGIGKTSLMHILAQIAAEAHYLVRYASCSEDASTSEFFRAIFADIPLLYHKDYLPTSEQVEEGFSFADLLPESTLSVPVISDAFSKLNGTRLLIILDEFDRANQHEFRRGIAELVKNLSDRSIGVQLVIAGVASNLTQLIEYIPSIRRNIRGLEVPNMSDEEVADMIQRVEGASGLTYHQEALQLICEAAFGLPYLASLLGQHAGLTALDRAASEVEWEDVCKAIDIAAAEMRYRISAKAIYQMHKVRSVGDRDSVLAAACAALRHGGRLVPEHLGGPVEGAEKLIRFRQSYGLIEPVEGDPVGAYVFEEEGFPVLLWLQFCQMMLAGRSEKSISLRRMIPIRLD